MCNEILSDSDHETRPAEREEQEEKEEHEEQEVSELEAAPEELEEPRGEEVSEEQASQTERRARSSTTRSKGNKKSQTNLYCKKCYSLAYMSVSKY